MRDDIILEMKNISKSFPGVKALDNACLSVRRGTVHALMGENGAGKSTLMKTLFGIYKKDEGSILLEGREVNFKSSKDALEHGVAMVHQELNQALKRSVADNLWLGRYPKKFGFIVSEKEMAEKTKRFFAEIGLTVDPKRIMGTLPVAERQMAEIAKAVSYRSKIIVLDEPTSSLTDREAAQLFKIIEMLKKRGCGIIYISHKMDEILKISDEVTIMRDGKYIATKPAAELTTEKIISLMVGRELTKLFPEKNNKPSDVILEVSGLTGAYSVIKDISFKLKKGEILGIAGLAGAGRTEVLETVFGMAEKKRGSILKNGKIIHNKNPRQAIKNGFALVTEERRATGIFGILGIKENTVISSLKKYKEKGMYLSEKQMSRDTREMIKSMRIKTPSQKTKIRTLSGGNQQKVIFGRWLLTQPDILMLDEPTRGVDVGAKYEIYQLITQIAESGRAVVMVSGEMPELLGICDRIIVMSGGRIAGEVDAKNTSQEEIMTLAAKYV